MKRKINIIGLTLFFTLTLFSFVFSEESMTITTYYPSPYGSYNELRTYSNTYLATDSGNVGIGTAAPGAKMEVAGQVKITGGSPGAGKVLTSDASGLASWQSSKGKQMFTVSGGFTAPAGVSTVWVTACGGGGGGGGGGSGEGGGGGGGGAHCVIASPVSVSGGTNYTITIGAGGTGAAENTNTNGTAGGTTSFGSSLSVAGGGAGIASISGSAGGAAGGSSASPGQAGGTNADGGDGGSSIFGAGGAGGNNASFPDGIKGSGYGAGGGGGFYTCAGCGNGGGGGNGSPCFVLVEW